jgi:uncharacterized protein YndB with AHSA1/START domain
MPAASISRLIKAPREAVYRACSEPAELARWRMPQTMSARLLGVDGVTYRMALSYPDGRVDAFEASFVERVPNERIAERIRFDAPDRAGEMTVITTLRPTDGGTEVTVLTENLPAAIRPEDNDEGTRQALARLAALLEC